MSVNEGGASPGTYSGYRNRAATARSGPTETSVAGPQVAAGEPMAAFGAAWRGMACPKCGRRPEELAPVDAVAATRLLQRRCASLLDHADDLVCQPRSGPSAWPAIERAEQVSVVLGAVNSRLRNLLGEEAVVTIPAGIKPPQRQAPAAVLASLALNVGRLAETIDGATSQDWYRPRPDDLATAAELVWLALHTTNHYVEDTAFTLEAGSAAPPVS